MVQPIPEGYHTVVPYLLVDDVGGQLAFVEQAFGARVTMQSEEHADVQIGDSHVMMGQARGEWQALPAMLYLYVSDTDATYAQALEAGGVSLQEPKDMYYGDRNAGVRDPSGNMWWIATHVEDVSPEEIQTRAAAARE